MIITIYIQVVSINLYAYDSTWPTTQEEFRKTNPCKYYPAKGEGLYDLITRVSLGGGNRSTNRNIAERLVFENKNLKKNYNFQNGTLIDSKIRLDYGTPVIWPDYLNGCEIINVQLKAHKEAISNREARTVATKISKMLNITLPESKKNKAVFRVFVSNDGLINDTKPKYISAKNIDLVGSIKIDLSALPKIGSSCLGSAEWRKPDGTKVINKDFYDWCSESYSRKNKIFISPWISNSDIEIIKILSETTNKVAVEFEQDIDKSIKESLTYVKSSKENRFELHVGNSRHEILSRNNRKKNTLCFPLKLEWKSPNHNYDTFADILNSPVSLYLSK